MIRIHQFTLFILITLTCLTANSAGIKKWVDENGNVFYGDTPPPSAQSQTIKTNKAPSNPGKPLPRLSTSSSPAASKPSDNSSQADVESTLEPEQAKEACETARKDLAVIEKSARIQLRSKDGSLRYMTKEEIATRLERSKNDIERFCR